MSDFNALINLPRVSCKFLPTSMQVVLNVESRYPSRNVELEIYEPSFMDVYKAVKPTTCFSIQEVKKIWSQIEKNLPSITSKISFIEILNTQCLLFSEDKIKIENVNIINDKLALISINIDRNEKVVLDHLYTLNLEDDLRDVLHMRKDIVYDDIWKIINGVEIKNKKEIFDIYERNKDLDVIIDYYFKSKLQYRKSLSKALSIKSPGSYYL